MLIIDNSNHDSTIIGALNIGYVSKEELARHLENVSHSQNVDGLLTRLVEEYGVIIKNDRHQGYTLDWPLSLYNIDKLNTHIQESVKQRLKILELNTTTESTNNVAKKYCNDSRKIPALVLSEHQSSGRGRVDNRWVSPLGQNVYYSLSFEVEKPLNDVANFALLVAIAVARTLKELCLEEVAIKWPNDVMISGKKLAGILVEAVSDYSSISTKLVVGIGLNFRMHPSNAELIDREFTDIVSHTGVSHIDKNYVVAVLTSHLFRVIDDFTDNGFLGFYSEYSSYDLTKNKEIILSHKLNGREIARGISNGVSDNGGIKIVSNGEEKIYYAGEISLKLI